MSKKNTYAETTVNKSRDAPTSKEFELKYFITGTIRTKIKAEDINHAYAKAMQATTANKILSEANSNMYADELLLIEISDNENNKWRFCEESDREDELCYTLKSCPQNNDQED